MELEKLLTFDTNTEKYKQCKGVIDSFNLLETIRMAIDYDILNNAIKDLESNEEKWNGYYDLVVENTRNELIKCCAAIYDKYNFDIEDKEYIKLCVVYEVIYKTFVGFTSETGQVINQLINDGYTILNDDVQFIYTIGDRLINDCTLKQYLDSKFSIDLRCIDQNGKLIGIQFKSESYLNLSFDKVDQYDDKIKDKHYKKHQKAINTGLVSEVYFIFHKANSNDILTLKEDKTYFNYCKGDYLIKSHHITTLNKYGKQYIYHKDFEIIKKLTNIYANR